MTKIKAIVEIDLNEMECDCFFDCEGCVPKYVIDGDKIMQQHVVRPGKVDSFEIGRVYGGD